VLVGIGVGGGPVEVGVSVSTVVGEDVTSGMSVAKCWVEAESNGTVGEEAVSSGRGV